MLSQHHKLIPMHKRFIILLVVAVTVISLNLLFKDRSDKGKETEDKEVVEEPEFSQNPYLVNECKVLESKDCQIHKCNGRSYDKILLEGDAFGYGGFTLSYEGAFVTFELGGMYESLTFTLGHHVDGSDEVGIVTAHADGVKVFDEKVRGYELPRQHTIHVAHIDKLTFKITASDLIVVVADAILWDYGQDPKPVTRKVAPAQSPKELVKEIKPYHVSGYMTAVTPDEHYIMLNRQTFDYGLRGNMEMALIGSNTGNAYFNLRGQYSKLSFITGCHDDLAGGAGSGWITVKADGKTIEEVEVREGEIAKQIVLDIAGCEMLSFHTEQSTGSSHAEMAQIMVYPAAYENDIELRSDGLAPPDPRLKDLPDVCKLISNITPYQVVGKVEKQIYTGSSDHITFSMGGNKYSEGIILYQTASFWDDNVSACATFDMGNEFDYISFTAGYIGKSWNMNNDYLMIYADDELIFTTELIATYPNQHFEVPIKKCRMLRICNGGSGTLDVAAFGVADLVAYRGKVVKNDLFVHPEPECPYEADLMDLGMPYIHYVSPMSNYKESMAYDGSTKKNFYEVNGERIYKGFLLQTSTHFSLDFGVLSNNGADNAAAGVVGAAAVGASFVATGAAVGGATVGASLAPMAAFLMLAAGGEAAENSLAAFNTYGEYNSVTFKVACLSTASRKSDYRELLMIGADQEVVANIGIYESMEPQEFTVPIDGCEQLMFWLANTNGTSSKYVIYDIVVSKNNSSLDIPVECRLSLPEKKEVKTTEYVIGKDYERYSKSKSDRVNDFLSSAYSLYGKVRDMIKEDCVHYVFYTYYLETSSGPCKAIQLRSGRDEDHKYDLDRELTYRTREVENLKEIMSRKAEVMSDYSEALDGLYELGEDEAKYREYIREYWEMVNECFKIADAFYPEKIEEMRLLQWVNDNAGTYDGVASVSECMLCPLTSEDVLPGYPLQHVKYFDMED